MIKNLFLTLALCLVSITAQAAVSQQQLEDFMVKTMQERYSSDRITPEILERQKASFGPRIFFSNDSYTLFSIYFDQRSYEALYVTDGVRFKELADITPSIETPILESSDGHSARVHYLRSYYCYDEQSDLFTKELTDYPCFIYDTNAKQVSFPDGFYIYSYLNDAHFGWAPSHGSLLAEVKAKSSADIIQCITHEDRRLYLTPSFQNSRFLTPVFTDKCAGSRAIMIGPYGSTNLAKSNIAALATEYSIFSNTFTTISQCYSNDCIITELPEPALSTLPKAAQIADLSDGYYVLSTHGNQSGFNPSDTLKKLKKNYPQWVNKKILCLNIQSTFRFQPFLSESCKMANAIISGPYLSQADIKASSLSKIESARYSNNHILQHKSVNTAHFPVYCNSGICENIKKQVKSTDMGNVKFNFLWKDAPNSYHLEKANLYITKQEDIDFEVNGSNTWSKLQCFENFWKNCDDQYKFMYKANAPIFLEDGTYLALVEATFAPGNTGEAVGWYTYFYFTVNGEYHQDVYIDKSLDIPG